MKARCGKSVYETRYIPHPLQIFMRLNQIIRTVTLRMNNKPSPFLSTDELIDLCGLKQGSAQAKFLQRQYGLSVPRRADGHVRVTWYAINEAVMKQKAPATTGPKWTK